MERLAPVPAPDALERAVRLLAVRSRRDVSSVFAGGYRSAFRGGGFEFEESRPYVPGDDVRSFDWNATARTGHPWVKCFREERDQTLLLALDVSRSMRFGTDARAKARVAAHAAALLAAAAARAGDRVGLVCFAAAPQTEIRPARGEGQLWRVLRALAAAAAAPDGGTDLSAALARVHGALRRRAVVVLLSDLRDAAFSGAAGAERAPARRQLVALARRHDVVVAVLHDPREDELPRVGAIRLADPEAGGRVRVLRSGSTRARELYQRACAARRRSVEHQLRADGADVLWLPTHRDPLLSLARFFRRHHGASGPLRGAPA